MSGHNKFHSGFTFIDGFKRSLATALAILIFIVVCLVISAISSQSQNYHEPAGIGYNVHSGFRDHRL